MKKVLIICDNFPPQSGPRMGYLVKYLKRLGWSAWVVTAENKSRSDLTGLSGYAEEVHVIPQKPHRKWNLLHILPFFWPYDYLRGEYDMRRKAFELVDRIKFDLILCTHTYGWFPVNTAWAAAKRAKLPLVIDIRDLSAQNPRTTFFQKSFSQKMDYLRSACSFISSWRAARIHCKAAALTAISPWHAEWLKRWNKNSFCIYNGFDPEFFKPVAPIKSGRFEILYTGSLATKRQRDPDLLLRAIRQLSDVGEISTENFVVKFYGESDGSHVIGAARQIGVDRFLEFYPFVPISQVPDLFARASALLLLAARSGENGTHGVMTTKFYEYLAANRPIVCVPSDEECLESAIADTQSGKSARTVDEVVSYLRSLLDEWHEEGVTSGRTIASKLALFSREKQAAQFVQIFERII